VQHDKLEKEKESLLAIQKEYTDIEIKLKEKEMLVAEQSKRIDDQISEIFTKKNKIKEQESIIWLSLIFIIIVSILGVLAYRSYRLKNKANKLVLQQKTEIEEQHKVLEEQHREITDSINYAKRIQEAILPPLKLVKGYMPDSFILYQPKDIVAGDFYWMEGVNNLIIFAAADCTGHGVPGAMVSVVCHNAMNRAVKEFMLVKPNEILDKTREIVLETFEKSDEDVNDGMDIALCSINTESKKLSYSGANNGLYLIRDGELTQVKPDKQPIGNYQDAKPFTLHEFDLKKGDVLYTFSDGYPDQFGGPKGKKFMYKNFRNLLLDIHQKPMNEQHSLLVKAFEEWRGAHEQIDDVCVIGVRI
jgi:serine phosphatase RsbU (regulator of sigma subunit)